ncbi:hypothetical protein NADFUDRAFT_28003 [Nadsonia fulvescens var. elongata DSM 6958]|uniref:Uncharacterized protein n=1 Tax=Nadsonia fulvescens var. elongata DSM 6958 TaxID=857566 RepID=A0A1E3PF01_9ASCO|nr:hypothetical protein NADFUDRAFT_28003 [Nadsonia fulvescens var. elongata DSM 6958]
MNSLKSSPVVVASDIEHPIVDDRKYRVIKLANDLEILVIHDPDTDKSSAALDVNVGSFSDPPTLPGLAHFCEHLLFMGTEKYPQENDYSQYLSEHSGYSNAYTSSDDTNYYFEVAQEYLEGALDRFAQFFIAPLFSPDCKEREIRAVDSENKKNLQSDMWRLYQLEKSMANSKHPYNNFSTGNYETLHTNPASQGIDVREELLKFHGERYSANLMKLVVLGRESLDTLEKWVVSMFSDVKNLNKPKPSYEAIPFTSKELKKFVKAKPVMDVKTLELNFPVPDQYVDYDTRSTHYFSHLIGHEGPGSLLFYLKKKGWVNSLSAGSMHLSKGTDMFAINLDLTDNGIGHYEEIIINIFQFLKLLSDTPPQEWIFNELRDVADANFKFSQKSGASSTASRLSAVMQRDLPREFLLSTSLMRKYDPSKLEEFIGCFTPDNFFAVLVGQELTGLDQKEKWYGTEYSMQNIQTDFYLKLKNCNLNEELHIPLPNEFIPTDFEVEVKEVESPLKSPWLILNEKNHRLWHKKDDRFWVPKAYSTINIKLPFVHISPSNAVKSSLFVDLINDALVEFAYDAEIAGLRYSVSLSRYGIHVALNGYNHKMSILLRKILQKFADFKVDPERFSILREKNQKTYKNFGYGVPYNQVGHYSGHLLNENVWSIEESAVAIDELTFEQMEEFASKFWHNFSVESLIHGNLSEDEAVAFAKIVDATFSPKGLDQLFSSRSLILPVESSHYLNVPLKDEKNINSCIDYMVQTGNIDQKRDRALVELLGQIGQEPAFNQLRTKEQLGYVVFSGVRTTRTTLLYRVLIQSERTTDYLEERIDAFLNKLEKILRTQTEEEFKTHVESLVAKRLEKKKNLSEEHARFWNHIQSGYYDFLQHEVDVEELNLLTRNDILEFFISKVSPKSKSRSKLVINLQSQHPIAQTSEKIIESGLLAYFFEVDLEVAGNDISKAVKEFDGKSKDHIVDIVELVAKKINEAEGVKFTEEQQSDAVKYLETILDDNYRSSYPEGTVIEDINHFKSSLEFTKDPNPVKELTGYKKPDSK